MAGIESDHSHISIRVEPFFRKILICCISLEIVFVLLDIFFNFLDFAELRGIRRICNIAREDSLASWFSSTQTFMVGVFLWLIAFVLFHTSSSKRKVVGWCLLALFFTYMAVDDGAMIHERLGTIFGTLYQPHVAQDASISFISKLIKSFPSYNWQVVFLPFLGSVGIFILIFLNQELKTKSSKTLIILALFCLVFAVGIDFIEGLSKRHPWNLQILIQKKYHLNHYAVRHFFRSAEEFIEMLGITLFWAAFVQYLKNLPSKKIMLSITDN